MTPNLYSSGEFTISLDDLQWKGKGLVRPECVLVTRKGDLFTADWRGGVAHIHPDGSQTLYKGELPGRRPLRPNGIALTRNGNFLLADLGEEFGGVFELTRDGEVHPFLVEVDGVELPPTNFVVQDGAGRTWVTVSTRHRPRASAYRSDITDGFIIRVDEKGARIAADGLGYTNEVAITPDGHFLYVNETFGRRLTRFHLGSDGSLSRRETITNFGTGIFPDGMALDSEGGVWITSIVSNRVIRVRPDGSQHLVLDDADETHVKWAEEAFLNGTMGRPHLDRCAGKMLRNISSIAFGGGDLRIAYLGCLLGDSLACFRSPIPGSPPSHWRY